MSGQDYCDLVLPDIKSTESDSKKILNQNSIQKNDVVPAPSCGDPVNSKESLEQDIEVRKVNNPFLSSWKSKNAKTSFRNVVRAIIRASRWMIPLVNEKEDHATDELNKTWYEDKDTLHFNVNAFKAGSSGNAGLSKRARFILMKNAWERTEDELELIHSVVNQMKCFTKYSNMVRRELTRVMHFETFEEGRIIIQEGHHGFSMYFIVTGSVIVQVSQFDIRTGEKKNHVVGEIPAGSSFGELALIQDCKRSATIVCKGTSQFLRVDKPDFDMVLRRSYEQEWEDKLHMLKAIPFFSNWDGEDLRNINLNCRLCDYLPGSVILGDIDDITEHIYFIASGICKLIKKVAIMETTSHLGKGQTMLSLPSQDDALKACMSKSRQMSTRFLVIGNLEKGDYFGVGENLKSTYILTSSRVECLTIPRHTLIAQERALNISGSELRHTVTMRHMLRTASTRLLDEEEAFERWMTNLRWKNFRKKTVNEVISRKPIKLIKKKVITRVCEDPIKERRLHNLGYPIANIEQESIAQIYRRAGFQLSGIHKVLPSIEEKETQNSDGGATSLTHQGGKRVKAKNNAPCSNGIGRVPSKKSLRNRPIKPSLKPITKNLAKRNVKNIGDQSIAFSL